ncbi:uncharacterized protein [Heterodontus francisci]|uniref:uncharacterized protein n=1 Tax=Heterodontus francisci TaxID=7792 RepID=UPI00355AECB5
MLADTEGTTTASEDEQHLEDARCHDTPAPSTSADTLTLLRNPMKTHELQERKVSYSEQGLGRILGPNEKQHQPTKGLYNELEERCCQTCGVFPAFLVFIPDQPCLEATCFSTRFSYITTLTSDYCYEQKTRKHMPCWKNPTSTSYSRERARSDPQTSTVPSIKREIYNCYRPATIWTLSLKRIQQVYCNPSPPQKTRPLSPLLWPWWEQSTVNSVPSLQRSQHII